MKQLSTWLFLLGLCMPALAQDTPSAGQIMDKYVAAIGGKELLASISDMRLEMSTEFNGNPVMITRKQKAPNKFLQVINANGMEVMRMTGNGSKLVMGGMQGSRTIEGKEAQMQLLVNTLFGELRYPELGVKSSVAGVEAIDGKDAYKVVHTSADGAVSWTDYYDKVSGLKVQTVSMGRNQQGPVTQTVQYADYKEFKGLKYPTSIAQSGGRAMKMSVDKVRINEGLKDAEFEAK